jgi:hypothetical protein
LCGIVHIFPVLIQSIYCGATKLNEALNEFMKLNEGKIEPSKPKQGEAIAAGVVKGPFLPILFT